MPASPVRADHFRIQKILASARGAGGDFTALRDSARGGLGAKTILVSRANPGTSSLTYPLGVEAERPPSGGQRPVGWGIDFAPTKTRSIII